jgi:hypothetical protein
MLPQLTRQRRIEISLLLKCSEQYLYQVLTKRREPSPLFAMKLHRVDPDLFKLSELREDAKEIWGAGA